jgi:hypothetical protein
MVRGGNGLFTNRFDRRIRWSFWRWLGGSLTHSRGGINGLINRGVHVQLIRNGDKENGRRIHPDTKLATLLKLKKTDELTYFNLQKYMSHHFAKANKEPVVAAV